ncbi:response regulator transcription factor [Streptomyces sp. ISL-10]|nr:response regulator transcription factor [Streptomyces sp. ISL-10]
MPRCDGVEATRRIRGEHPATQSSCSPPRGRRLALPRPASRARGHLTKDADGDEIVRAVQDVMAGRAGLSAVVQQRLLEQVTAEPRPAGPRLPDGLTAREGEVLTLIAEGLGNADIGRRLRISTATVKTHINNLFTKAGLHDRAQAVRYACREGLAQPPGAGVT